MIPQLVPVLGGGGGGGGGAVARQFTISPAVSGKSTWDLDADGPLNLGTAGTWDITPLATFEADTDVWGAGGGENGYPAGAGGYAAGLVTLTKDVAYKLYVGASPGTGSGTLGGAPGGGRSYGSPYGGGGGGGYSGLRTAAGDGVLIAGGGGGSAWGASGSLGAGGGSSGQSGTTYVGTPGAAGTQSVGTLWQGGNGTNTSDTGGGGGGGGYRGGGGGTSEGGVGGAGGGGGSGYFDPASVASAVLTAGSGTTPGQSGHASRGTAGNVRLPGRVILT